MRKLLGLTLAVGLVLSACGSNDDDRSEPTGSGPGVEDIVDNPEGVHERTVDRYAAYTECVRLDEVPNSECPTPAEQADSP